MEVALIDMMRRVAASAAWLLAALTAIGPARLLAQSSDSSNASKLAPARWIPHDERDPITDAHNVGTMTFDVAQDRSTPILRARALMLRCQAGKLEAIIDFATFLGHDGDRVVTRIDSLKPEREKWSLATNEHGVFYGGDVRRLLERLSGASRYAAQVIPYHSGPLTAIFDVTGVDSATAPVLAACKK